MWRLIYGIPSWIMFQVFIFIPLCLLGWVLVPVAALYRAYHMTSENLDKPNDGPIFHFTWPIMFVWDNWEDGIANQNYKKFDTMFMRIVYWSCLRNPVNNLRIVPYLSCKIDPKRVGFLGTFGSSEQRYLPKEETQRYDSKVPHWFFAWQGFYTNFYWQFVFRKSLYRLWFGTAKIYPTDIYGGPYGYREKGAGSVSQFKRVLKYE